MSNYYPLMVDLENKPVLVVGGGNVALRKVETLLAHNALVTIISPVLLPELETFVDSNHCKWIKKEYDSGDLRDAILVFCCTDKEEVNLEVSGNAKSAFRLVNVVDDPEKCTFIVPSILERGDLTVAVSTGGSSPIVARQIRAAIGEQYGEEIEEYLALLKSWRNRVKTELSPQKKESFWTKVTDGDVLEMIKSGRLQEAKGVVEDCFQSLLD